MKTIILTALLNLLAIISFADHGPRIQFIHNSPAESVASIDLWYNWTNFDEVYAPTKIVESLDYKKATPFNTYTLVYGDLIIYVTPEGSSDTSNYLFKKTFGQPQIDYYETFVVVLSGIPGDDFDLILNDGQLESANPFKSAVSVFHGSPDAPTVNIAEISIPAGIIVNNLQYEESTDYLSLDPLDYVLQVQTTDGTAVADFNVPLSSFAGEALFVAATGYLDISGATPDEPFKLIAATADGSVIEIDPVESLSTARVQVIHNSADAAAEVVDVWLNETLLLDNFTFRTASPFIDAPAGEEFTIAIKGPGSQNPNNPIWSQNYTLTEGETYILVAEGIVSSTGYNPATPFDIAVYSPGQEESSSIYFTDVLIHHGATDAPTIDIYETGAAPSPNLYADNLMFGDFTNYLQLVTPIQILEVRDESGNNTVATYQIPPGLMQSGTAFTVVASGFLNPGNNSDGADFGLWIALPSGGELIEMPAPGNTATARVQVIHNSADAAAEVVDVWLNETLLLDNFTFRTASPFIDAPAGEEFTIAIKGPDSQNPNNPIWSQNYTLAADETYILVAEGIVSPSGYDPATPFDIAVYGMGRESASASGDTDILVHHGSTDAPTVDVVEVGVGFGTVVDDISYGEFDGYLELPTSDDYLLNLFEPQFGTFATYEAPLASLGLDGAAITVVASGFLNPENNSNGAEFGLWVALASGGELVELPLIPPTPLAYVQVIHNSADAAAEVVDVWLNDELLLDDFAFRTASITYGLPAGETYTVSIKGPDSQNPDDPIWSMDYTLEEDKTYILVAEGIVSPTGYNPPTPFDIAVYDMGQALATNPGNTDVLVYHGSTDAPTVDVYETGVGAGEIVNDLSYSEFAGYLELPTDDYTLEIRDETGTSTVAAYQAPLATIGLEGASLVVVASGFLNPANNNNGPAFGLWVALPFGGPMLELTGTTGVEANIIDDASVVVYPNPTSDLVNINYDLLEDSDVNIYLYDLNGRLVKSSSYGTIQKSNQNSRLNLNDLKSGLYYLNIQAGQSIISRKIQVIN